MLEPRIFKGARDFLPDEMILREEILNIMRTVFQIYGFEPIETQAIEYLNVPFSRVTAMNRDLPKKNSKWFGHIHRT
jgi:histidyl-tRNA synthetase